MSSPSLACVAVNEQKDSRNAERSPGKIAAESQHAAR